MGWPTHLPIVGGGGVTQLLSFLCLRTSKTLSLGVLNLSVKLIFVLSSFHMLFLSIFYSYSCKTHIISSKLGFV